MSINESDDFEVWKQITATVHSTLPDIDNALAEGNLPVKDRPRRALDLFFEMCTEIKGGTVSDIMSTEAYARLFALVNDWYRTRYGRAFDDAGKHFSAAVEIFGSPFLLAVPATFTVPGKDKGTVWLGFPDKVQEEEDVLKWIADCPNLTPSEQALLKERATLVADAVRSIIYDLRAIPYDTDEFGQDLVASIGADLNAAALDLCAHDDGRLRNAGWHISQATEKALKLAIHRFGAIPDKIHDLDDLSRDLEQVSSINIDKVALSRIPSGKKATGLRYGGQFSLPEGLGAYQSALFLVKPILRFITPKREYDARNARFLLKTPPWFSFETDAFIKAMKEISCNI